MVCASHILFTDVTPEVKNWESVPKLLDAGGIHTAVTCPLHAQILRSSFTEGEFMPPLLLGCPV